MLHHTFVVGLWLLDGHNYILSSELILLKTYLLMTLNCLRSEITIEWYLI
jgi:hypothetical protein